MSDSVEIISDGDGFAVVGSEKEINDFLESLALTARPLPIQRAHDFATRSSSNFRPEPNAMDRAAVWIRSTERTLRTLEELGLAPSGLEGVFRGILKRVDAAGGWSNALSASSQLTSNPMMLSGVAGLLAQAALESALEEIADYLKTIDRKLDDLIRSQTNAILARVDGVRFAVDEAFTIKQATGKVSDVTWSKIQSTSLTLFETESYAIRQIQDETYRIKVDNPVADILDSVQTAAGNIPMWLTILTNCAALYDSIAILELDRVMDTNPSDLDQHRIGLQVAREKRLKAISVALESMLDRVTESVDRANTKVLFNPIQTPKTVESCRTIAISIIEVSAIFGVTTPEQSADARRWVDAATERIEATRQATSGTAEAVQHVSKEAAANAKALKGKISNKIAERRQRKSDS